GAAHRGHGGEVAAEGPAEDPGAREVHLRVPRPGRLQAGHLVGERNVDQVALDGSLPGPAAPWGAAAVEGEDDEAVVGDPLVEQVRSPGIAADGLDMGTGVDAHQHRVPAASLEGPWTEDRGVERQRAELGQLEPGEERRALGDGAQPPGLAAVPAAHAPAALAG